jgi:CheY-like chemotaxis protein
VRRRILVIEDDGDTREVMTAALEAAGYAVTATAEAFGNIKKLAPDLVILDLFLHGEAHGWEQLDILTLDPKTRGIPVILCTAGRNSLEAHRPKLLAMDLHVLEKPFDLDVFLRAIERLLPAAPVTLTNI